MSRSEPSLQEWRDFLVLQKPASPTALMTALKTVLAREPVLERAWR
jgi:hypothetical protein